MRLVRSEPFPSLLQWSEDHFIELPDGHDLRADKPSGLGKVLVPSDEEVGVGSEGAGEELGILKVSWKRDRKPRRPFCDSSMKALIPSREHGLRTVKLWPAQDLSVFGQNLS